MNLIEKLGLGMAEAIASCLLTTAINPEYFCLDPKQYFNVVDGVVYFYNDDEQQFFEYKPLAECDFVYVSIADLRTSIVNHEKCQHEWNETTSNGDVYRFFVCKHCDSTQNYVPFKDDNPSHFDHCTDIRNHISPLTGVIEG